MSDELTNRRLIVETPNAAGAVGPYSQVPVLSKTRMTTFISSKSKNKIERQTDKVNYKVDVNCSSNNMELKTEKVNYKVDVHCS